MGQSIADSQQRAMGMGQIPSDNHPDTALLMWGPTSVEHHAENGRFNQTAVHAYRSAYDSGDLDGAIEATYTLQTGVFSPDTGLDLDGFSLYETIEEDSKRILWEEWDGLERFATLLALFPKVPDTSNLQGGPIRYMIQQQYNKRVVKRRREAKSWTLWIKNKLRNWLGDEK
jgi:hypothetical protein